MIENQISEFLGQQKGKVSIVLKDLGQAKWIYLEDESRQVPSASTIKILIMAEAFRQVENGNFSLNQKVHIKQKDKVPYSIISDLTTDLYTFRDLITLMIIVSDNTATNVLIDLLGYPSINRMAQDLGLNSTVLQRRMMDFDATKEGRQNYTSPLDMAKLVESIHNQSILSQQSCDLMIDIMKRQKDKAMIGKYIPEDIVVAHKTGELENLNHDIGILYLSGKPYLLGVFVTEADGNLMAREIIAKGSKIIYEYLLQHK